MRRVVYLLLVIAAFGAVCTPTLAFARNVDLSTVPKREQPVTVRRGARGLIGG
jgi:hypothetical protein